jgi:hypothetical protein
MSQDLAGLEMEKKIFQARHRYLMPVILVTQEAEIRRTAVQSQPGKVVYETLSRKNSLQKGADGVVKGVGPEFELQYCKKKKKTFKVSSLSEKSKAQAPGPSHLTSIPVLQG